MALDVRLLGGLGIIPDYQFSSDPAVNPYGINPHVKFPEGWNQMTVQPVGQWPTSGESNLQGLGATSFLSRLKSRMTARTGGNPCGAGCWPIKGGGCDCSTMITRTMGGFGTPMLSVMAKPVGLYGIFESGWWQQRKWLALGLLGVVGAGAAAFAVKTLR